MTAKLFAIIDDEFYRTFGLHQSPLVTKNVVYLKRRCFSYNLPPFMLTSYHAADVLIDALIGLLIALPHVYVRILITIPCLFQCTVPAFLILTYPYSTPRHTYDAISGH